MDINIEKVNSVEKTVKVILAWENVSDDYDKIVKKLRKNLKLSGFRPGKVPMGLAKRHLAPNIQYEFVNKIIEKTFQNVLEEKNMTEYVDSSLENVVFKEGEPFEYTIKLEVDPQITLPDYKSDMKLTRKKYIVSDDDIELYMDEIKKEKAEVLMVDGAVEEGFFINCNLEKLDDDGNLIEGEKIEGRLYEVGVKPLDDKNAELLIGKNVNDVIKINLELEAGQPSDYNVTIIGIEEHKLPEINDEWVKTNLTSVDSLEAWKKQVSSSMQKDLETRAKQEFDGSIQDWFLNNMEFEVPKSRISHYLDGMVNNFKTQSGNMKVDENEIRKYYEPQAEKSVKWFMIEGKIKDDEGIAITSEDFDKKVEELVSSYPEDQREQFVNIYKQDAYKQQIEMQLISDKIMEHILENAQIDTEEIKSSDLRK